MNSQEMFWSQFWELFDQYGLNLLVLTIVGGATFGYLLHYIKNVLPMKKIDMKEETDDEQEEVDDEEEEEEESDKMETLRIGSGKQVGVVRGMINRKVVAALRPVYSPNSGRGLKGAMEDIVTERRELLGETDDTEIGSDGTHGSEGSEKEDSETEYVHDEALSEDHIPFTDLSLPEGENRRPSLTEIPVDPVMKLGTLHGKLATAQLRARTRQMQMEMSAEERESEAEMKNRQLESIMALMMQNKEKFGMNKDDVKEQLSLYNF